MKTKAPRAKAESQAKRYGRARGRVVKLLELVPGTGVMKRFRFELRPDGLHVGRAGARRKSWRILPLAHLANLGRPQPELFPDLPSTKGRQ